MTIADVSRFTTHGLPPTLTAAQAAMQLPEVQDMLRRLSAFHLGIFMPHRHDDGTGEFQPLPDEVTQLESGRAVSFERVEEISRRTETFLPVGWRWCDGASTVAAVCEMADQDGSKDEQEPIKHKHPEKIR